MCLRIWFFALLTVLWCGSAVAQTCSPTTAMHAVPVTTPEGDTSIEVAGNAGFGFELDNGWTFELVRDPAGWSIRLFDHATDGTVSDLTSLTPPHGGAPNPRDILGWHFRNAANTGPNEGDVNAPQHLRGFVISPGLAGTGGYKASTDPGEPRLIEPGPDDGIGWLRVEDMGLSNLVAGEQATMNYLKFSACLSWPKSEAEQMAEADAASLEFNVLDRGLFTGCGLDFTGYELNAQWLPRRLTIDIDGNSVSDVVAQVVRVSDGTRGLALCRNAAEVQTFGFDEADAGDGLRPGYVGQTEAWQWITPGSDRPMHLANIELPEAAAGLLVLERVEKEAVAVYWQSGRLHSRQLNRYVEP